MTTLKKYFFLILKVHTNCVVLKIMKTFSKDETHTENFMDRTFNSVS